MEWPLERNIGIAREMAALGRQHGATTIAGLQATFSPAIQKIRQMLATEEIGKVLSSSVVGSLGLGFGGAVQAGHTRFFLDRNVGGNLVTIHGAHVMDSVAAGELFLSILCFRSALGRRRR